MQSLACTVVCPECLGDGGHDVFTGGYCRHTGSPMTDWQECGLCDGRCEVDVPVEPIEMEDLENITDAVSVGISVG
jgi:hypothetical protein